MDIFCLIRYKHVAFNTCYNFIWFQLFNAFLLDIQDDAPPLVMFIFAFWFLSSFAFNMVFHICNSISSLPDWQAKNESKSQPNKFNPWFLSHFDCLWYIQIKIYTILRYHFSNNNIHIYDDVLILHNAIFNSLLWGLILRFLIVEGS